jgi:signal transduction histidine kinase
VPPRVDTALTAGVIAATIVCVYTAPLGSLSGEVHAGDAVGVGIAVGMALPLAFRRRWPLGSLLVAGVFSVLALELDYATDPADVYLLFGVASAALFTRRRMAIGLAVVWTAYQLYWWLSWTWPELDASQITSALAWGLLPPLAGDAMRVQRAYTASLADRVERQARVHELELLHTAETERLRIARELHDIVGHHLSAITVQARAISTLVDRAPQRAREGLSDLASLATSALEETRSSVAALRQGQAAPQPTLEAIDELVEVARLKGVNVDVRVEGDRRPLPAPVELCAYRVLQEALTNVARHGGADASAAVHVGYDGQVLRLDVRNPLQAPANDHRNGDADGVGGHGLIGMRERAQVMRGSLTAGPDGADWRVHAELPVGGA